MREYHHMKWFIIDSVACPLTCTFFSTLVSEDNNRIIMWSSNHLLFETGEEIIIDELDGSIHFEDNTVNIFLIRPFRSGLWKTICSGIICPGDARHRSKICSYPGVCNFKKCPYGLNSHHKKR